jgi:hypothetical protein
VFIVDDKPGYKFADRPFLPVGVAAAKAGLDRLFHATQESAGDEVARGAFIAQHGGGDRHE